MKSFQKDVYEKIHNRQEYLMDLPDYKIAGGIGLKNKRILVLGVGTGRDVRYLCKENKVYGLDFSTSAVKVAAKFGIIAETFDLSQPLNFKKNFFDIIVAKDVFEHLENPLELLSQCKSILKKSGYVVVSVPNHFYFPFRLRILFGGNLIWKSLGHDHARLFKEWNYMHTRYFTWKGFQEFIKAGGFRIERKFWDFGTLAHYSQPEMAMDYLRTKRINKVALLLMMYGWNFFNLIIPRRLRWEIVNLAPGFFCAGFYVWCRLK